MLSISPVSAKNHGIISPQFKGNNGSISNPNPHQKDFSLLEKTLMGVAAIGVAGLLIANRRNLKFSSAKKLLSKSQIQDFWQQMNEFPEDILYRKSLLKVLNLPNKDLPVLRSIIGGQEYRKIVSDLSASSVYYTPGEVLVKSNRDAHNLTGVHNRLYRANLHNHTVHSDGKNSVSEILEQAAKYADEVAEFNKGKTGITAANAPFTVAITDHDTLEGCKEAVRIISQNPEKYKNLRVVLGIEMTVENLMLKDKLKKPVGIHLVCNAINPFDKELNEFLNAQKTARQKAAARFFRDCTREISKIDEPFMQSINYEEIKASSKMVRDGLNYPWYFIKKFIENKMRTSWGIRDNISNQQKIQSALNRIADGYTPEMYLLPEYTNMEKAINLISGQKYGYMTFAHPAYTNIGSSLKNPQESRNCMAELFRLIKQKGKERFLGAEIYYPYEGEKMQDTSWLKLIENSAFENDIVALGGMDTHGKSIFFSNK